MTDHERYDLFCALSATCQLDALETAELDAHRKRCVVCRDRLEDMQWIGMQLRLNAALGASSTPMPAGSLERFRLRVLHEGMAPRSAPATAFATHKLASAAALFAMVVALVFMPHGRKVAEGSRTSHASSIEGGQSRTAGLVARNRVPRRSKVVRTRFVRHDRPRVTGAGVSNASLIAQRFPQIIAASYPYFEPQTSTKVTVTDPFALSGVHISSSSDFFHTLGLSAAREAATGQTPHARIDVASTGNVFDFTVQIRQLHFQLSTAQ